MNIITLVNYYHKNPKSFVEMLTRILFPGHLLSDKMAISIMYWLRFGKKINLTSPNSFNEKLLWLTLYDRRSIYTCLVDKYEAKNYIKKRLESKGISTNCIIPTYGIYQNFDEIDFMKLPEQFVMKTTHASGGVVVCSDKKRFDIASARKKIERSLKENYYWFSREWAYKDVKPRIIVEKYIDTFDVFPKDYKIFCFNGKPKFWFLASNRNTDVKFDYMDLEWNILPVKQGHPNSKQTCSRVYCWEEMLECAEALSEGFPHLRVDFYVDGDNFFIGELTLTHFSGLVRFEPDEYDYIFGKYLSLPKK